MTNNVHSAKNAHLPKDAERRPIMRKKTAKRKQGKLNDTIFMKTICVCYGRFYELLKVK